MNSKPRVPWSPGDRLLMTALGLTLPLALGLVLWLRALDQNPNVSLPMSPMPAKNARPYYLAAAGALLDSSKIDSAIVPWKPTAKPSGDQHSYSLGEKQTIVAENAEAIRMLHKGLQYPYREPPSRSFSTPFPHYQKIRALARFLSLESQVSAAEGDWGGSVNASLDAVQVGEELPHGGPLIGMLVGAACQAIGRKQAWAASDHLNASQAKAAARRLESIRVAHVPFADTLQEEKRGTQASLLELMRQPSWPNNFLSSASPDQDQQATSAKIAFATRIRLRGKRTIMADYTEYLDRLVADARQPYAAHLAPPPIPADPISQIILPVFTQVRLREVEDDTQNALLLVTLALQALKSEHGVYPASLSALVPDYLRTVPTDPFALSGPLHYKRTEVNCVLYSVGPDGRDDSGEPIFDRSKPAPGPNDVNDRRRYVLADSKGDVVAGLNIN